LKRRLIEYGVLTIALDNVSYFDHFHSARDER
jgi:hypothetical protein